jgi:glycosyltransferase involved in cell wall biosynthesis
VKIKRMLNRAKEIIVISEDMQKLSRVVSASTPLHLIPCQLGDEFLVQRKGSPRTDRFRLFRLGGTLPSKATDVLIRAVDILLRRGVDCQLTLAAMSKHAIWLDAERVGAGIPVERIIIIPRISDADLTGAYADSDLHVMPSRGEGFGMPVNSNRY